MRIDKDIESKGLRLKGVNQSAITVKWKGNAAGKCCDEITIIIILDVRILVDVRILTSNQMI